MNDPYSSWAARHSPEAVPLAARYQSADPIRLRGSMVYPMYTEQIGPSPTTVTVTMLSAAPPAGLRGLGIGLSVVDGYVDLHGRLLGGVDAWSDALAAGVGFHVTPTAPSTLVRLTPVWVDEFGTQKSWTGNYGIVVEHQPEGRVVLWCSIGEGPPNFANLVVEVSTAPAVGAPNAPAAVEPTTTPMAMSTPAASSASPEDPPTAPTTPVPRIDAAAVESATTAIRKSSSPLTTSAAADILRPASSPQASNAVQHTEDAPSPPFGPPVANTQPEADSWISALRPQPSNTQTTHIPQQDEDSPLFPTMPNATSSTQSVPSLSPQNSPPPAAALGSAPSSPPVGEPAAADAPPQRTTETKHSGDPGYRDALYDLGVALSSMGEEEQACGLWAQAAAAGHAGAAYELGLVRYRHGDPVGAESWWRTAADRREPRAMAGLADLLAQQGKHTEADSGQAGAAEHSDVVAGPPSG
ncbi:hypothetical protein [Nocardia sp. R6R-6]|uniref:hypothetical protein n=1 Tax=Nocardia sp. R6R-6 TaxID=3459303 RepID=UPI00403D8229